MEDLIPIFMDITSVADTKVAQQFLEMSGGDIETAVSLYFEHGQSLGSISSAVEEKRGADVANDVQDDEELAQKLQQELYKQNDDGFTQNEIRRPIEPTHDTLIPQEYDGYGYHPQYQPPQGGMFGRTQRSVFNQDVIDLDSDNDDGDGDYQADYNDDYELNQMTSTQRRLANIFRPPWDLISKIDLNTAKKIANEENKWVLINIQDVTDFRCQCLNRDFWSNQQIKEIVKHNFVFLQYHSDSPSGENYRNFYPFDDYPHIAILDPITGERMMVWNENPPIIKWVQQVVEFLDKYDNNNDPIVTDDTFGLNKEHPIELEDEYNEEEDVVQVSDDDVEERSVDKEQQSGGLKIQAINHADPPANIPASDTTRIQIRSGDGRRVVKKLLLKDSVLHLFEFVKFYFKLEDEDGEEPFTLKMQGIDLSQCLDETVEEAGLKNASLMLEML